MSHFKCQWRGVDKLITRNSSEGAAGYVAHHVATGPSRRKSDGVECIHYFRERFDGKPVKLDGLAYSDVGQVAGVFAREVADDAKLFGREDAVGNGDAHHEKLRGQPLAAFATRGAHAIALGIDAPPFEVVVRPFGDNAGSAFAREGAHLVKGLPWVLFALQAFSALGLCFFFLDSWSHFSLFGDNKNPAAACAVSRAFKKPWIPIGSSDPGHLRARSSVQRRQQGVPIIRKMIAGGLSPEKQFFVVVLIALVFASREVHSGIIVAKKS